MYSLAYIMSAPHCANAAPPPKKGRKHPTLLLSCIFLPENVLKHMSTRDERGGGIQSKHCDRIGFITYSYFVYIIEIIFDKMQVQVNINCKLERFYSPSFVFFFIAP